MALYIAHLTIISLIMLGELVQEFLRYSVRILNIFSIGRSIAHLILVSLTSILFYDFVYTLSC